MSQAISIKKLAQAIRKLPSDEPRNYPRKWYRTQKEHWLGWLGEYGGPGAYGRKGSKDRGAKFVYNHIIEYRMLLWLIDAAGLESKLVKMAKAVVDTEKSLQANSATIRKIVPWELLENALWRNAQN